MTPTLSIVILTLDEEEHIGPCLDALARQDDQDFEVLVVDAASTDGTLDVVREAQQGYPVPLRLEASSRRLPVGEARNLGIEEANGSLIGFLSADVQAHPGWTRQAKQSLQDADIVYGRQVHTPPHRTPSAAVRGLRYHFPADPTDQPARYASNANAALRREIPTQHPFGGTNEAGAVDDLLLTQRAAESGCSITYDPDMVVSHRDVTSFSQELNKNLREASGWGAHPHLLGYHWPVLDWGILLLAGLLAVSLFPGLFTLSALLTVLYLPAARRVARRWDEMPTRDLLVGFLASPPFDLAFLARYVQTLILEAATSTHDEPTEETHP